MPPDTIYIPGVTGPLPQVDTFIKDTGIDSAAIMEYLQRHVDSLGRFTMQEKINDGPQFLFPQWQMFLFVLLVLVGSAYFYIIRPASAKKKKTGNFFVDDSAGDVVIEIKYDQWLSKYNPYYNSLPAELKKRFLQRTVEFRESKEFRYHFMQPEEHIPVLISGAAVQLTFGLGYFLIEYFSVINIVKKEYSISQYEGILEGHVSNLSISISWRNFIADYENYTDSENVGLHEMAHAISFDVFHGNNENNSSTLTRRFKEYIHEAGPVFKELRRGKNQILDDYGAINVEEFWAVSIETFFENPAEFREKMPGLYDAICELLNQDPLSNEKIIDKRLAGLAN